MTFTKIDKTNTKKNNPSKLKKQAMLEALKSSLGNISIACEKVGISRQGYYNWLEQDKDFKFEIDNLSIEERALDFVEGKLFEQIKNGDRTCIIFFLKTKGKKRGYIENGTLEVNLESKGLIKDITDLYQKGLNEAGE